jgi:hypothetical protein
MRRAILTSVLTILIGNAAYAAPTCHIFDGDASGAYTSPWLKALNGPPVTSYIIYSASGGFGPGLTVEVESSSDKWLQLDGNSATTHRLDFWVLNQYPTTVTLNVTAEAGAITLKAYDSTGTPVDSDTAPNNATTAITLTGSEVAYVELTGGDNEDHIDDVCMSF